MFLWLVHLDKQSSQNVRKMWQRGERGGGFCALVHPVFCNLLCFCLSFEEKLPQFWVRNVMNIRFKALQMYCI